MYGSGLDLEDESMEDMGVHQLGECFHVLDQPEEFLVGPNGYV